MNQQPLHRSSSLKDLQATRDTSTSSATSTQSHSLASISPPYTATTTTKYQLWPSSKSPVGHSRSNYASDKLAALAVGRSSTSLSDTAVLPESLPFWQRTGSLSRRRKVSVPELGSTMTTVQEMTIDSRKSKQGSPKPPTVHSVNHAETATIPGRPPLRKISYEAFGHERSCSAPGTNWRADPFGNAMMACVTGPSPVISQQATVSPSTELTASTGRPLSPILSPGATPKPVLKLDIDDLGFPDFPPQVPPKSPTVEQRRGSPAPLILHQKSSKPQLTTPASATCIGTPLSAMDLRRSPNGIMALHTPPSTTYTNPFYANSPVSARGSPRTERKDPIPNTSTHNRNMSEPSIMDRGRPKRRGSKRQRSRTLSETNEAEGPVVDAWTLPQGMRVPEATRRMSDADKKLLHKQAYDQAGNFEVLNKRDVASLSRVSQAKLVDEFLARGISANTI